MQPHDLEYRGARLSVQRYGGGWRVLVFLGGGGFAEANIPNTSDPGGQAQVIAEARALVDRARG